MKTLLDDALAAIDRGWSIIPVHSVTSKGLCTCGDPKCPDKDKGKHNITRHAQKDATTNKDLAREWWSLWSYANLALVAKPSNILPLDVDPRNGGFESLAQLEAQYGKLPRTVKDKTQGGGNHILFERPKGIENLRGKLAPGIDVKANGYILIPASVGARGPYTWDNSPNTTRTATLPDQWLDLLLKKSLDAPMPSDALQVGGRKQAELESMLRGAWRERYESRSEHEQAIVSTAVQAGIDFETIYNLFKERAYQGAKFWEKYDRSERAAREWMRENYRSACELVALGDRADIREARKLVQNLKVWALGASWAGRTGATDQRTYLAHLQIADKAGTSKQYHASARDVAELAGIDKFTASKSNERLVKSGMIEHGDFFNPAYPTLAARFSLVIPGGVNCVHSHTPPHTCTHYAPPQIDAFRKVLINKRYDQRVSKRGKFITVVFGDRVGLGKAAHQIFDAIESLPGRTIGEIAKQTGRDRSTVRRVMCGTRKDNKTSLFALGMIRAEIAQGKSGAIWFAHDAIDWQQLAKDLRTADATALQMARHSKERERNTKRAELKRGNGKK